MTRGRKLFQGLDCQLITSAPLFEADSVPHGDYRHNDSQHRHGIQNYGHQTQLPRTCLPGSRTQLSSPCCIDLVGICQIIDRRGSSATDIRVCAWCAESPGVSAAPVPGRVLECAAAADARRSCGPSRKNMGSLRSERAARDSGSPARQS